MNLSLIKHVQPKGDKQTGRGGGRQMVRLLCSSGVSLIVSGGGSSSFSFALQFPLVRVCFRPTFRLAFAPSGVLLGLILSAIAFAGGGGLPFPSVWIPPHFLSSTDCSGLPSLVASWNFQQNFIKEGQATFHFSPVYVCVLRLF